MPQASAELVSRKPILSVFAHPDDVRRWTEQPKYLAAAGEYLAQFHWDVFCTPTFRYDVSTSFAMRSTDEFITNFGTQAYAAVAIERGPISQKTHVHLLVGGLGTPAAISVGHNRWQRGDIKSEGFDPTRGAAWYLMKDAYDEPDVFDIIGTPKRWHARRRKRGRHDYPGGSCVSPE
jgi:hypothetical protein